MEAEVKCPRCSLLYMCSFKVFPTDDTHMPDVDVRHGCPRCGARPKQADLIEAAHDIAREGAIDAAMAAYEEREQAAQWDDDRWLRGA